MKQETIFAQHQQWCVHYHREGGMPKNERCLKGIIYDELTRNAELGTTGCALRLPCIRSHHDPAERRGRPLCECPHLKWPTVEESHAHEVEIRAHMDKMMAATVAIEPIRKAHKGKDWAGVIECPICKGKLHVRHHGYNEHCWVKCETEDCVSWVE